MMLLEALGSFLYWLVVATAGFAALIGALAGALLGLLAGAVVGIIGIALASGLPVRVPERASS